LLISINFDFLFNLFHNIFFSAGSWLFPANSLLITMYPKPFWIAAATKTFTTMTTLTAIILILGLIGNMVFKGVIQRKSK
jgi:uncharacterized membrane protein